MKIGVLTLPLHTNYGGILQAYAMVKVLKNLGHDSWLINYYGKKKSKIKNALICFPEILFDRSFFAKMPGLKVVHQFYQSKELDLFIENFIQPQTCNITLQNKKEKIAGYNFEAFVVGSDQVWREEYCRSWKEDLFLDFVKCKNVRRISYAASFGTNIWEYDGVTTTKLYQLANKFDAISVREMSGLDLCLEHLKITAKQHLDPTMLLGIADYLNLSINRLDLASTGLYSYILDETEDKNTIINKLSKTLKYNVISLYRLQGNFITIMQKNKFPSVSEFLDGFNKAKFVITDSYHGCVFSILFNKPFFAIGNIKRGLDRFESLLRIFQLESRLIMSSEDLSESKISEKINWGEVNEILSGKRIEALNFLKEVLE